MNKAIKPLFRLIFIFLLVISVQKQVHGQASPRLKIGWDPNVETYFIAERLAVETIGWYVFDNKSFDYSHQPMVTAAFNHFKNYKDSAVIQRIAVILLDFRERFGDNLPILDYLLYQKPFPAKGPLYQYHFGNGQSAENKTWFLSAVSELTDSLYSFYRKAHVGEFLNRHKRFYDGAVAEVKRNINTGIYTAMEKYFGQKFSGYYILVTPTMPLTAGEDNYRGMGVSLHTQRGIIACMIISTSVMLPVKPALNQYTAYGYDNPRVIQFLAVHEIIHSFVNPQLESYVHLIDKNSSLYTPELAAFMKPQGIPNWQICVTEHLVRLGEIRIAEAMNDKVQANSLRNMHINSFHFVLLPLLEQKMKEYEENRHKYPSFNDFLPILLSEFHGIKPEKIDALLHENQKGLDK